MSANMKHTPGPWHVGTSHGDASTHGVIIAAAGENQGIAFVSTRSWCPRSEALDNARLIAAAPAMLEALQACVAATTHNGRRAVMDLDGNAQAMIRAAIAAATNA